MNASKLTASTLTGLALLAQVACQGETQKTRNWTGEIDDSTVVYSITQRTDPDYKGNLIGQSVAIWGPNESKVGCSYISKDGKTFWSWQSSIKNPLMPEGKEFGPGSDGHKANTMVCNGYAIIAREKLERETTK